MIIGLHGKIGSGKDTVALMLADMIQCRIMSFAKKLKEQVAAKYGISYELLLTEEGKNTIDSLSGKTYGRLLQEVGMEMRMIHGDNHWIDSLFKDIGKMTGPPTIVITDVRFPNEVAAIKHKGGVVIRIVGDPRGINAKTTRDRSHPSETALDGTLTHPFNYTISNTGSIDDLRARVRDIVWSIQKFYYV
jgi:hypothetical protein